MRRFFRSLTAITGFKLYFLGILLLLPGVNPVLAADYALQGGLGFSIQEPMLLGFAVSLNRRGESEKGSWFSDTQLVYHLMRSVSDSSEANASASITLTSYELNWFFLLPVKLQSGSRFFWGPGIGYGIAEVDEDVSYEGRGAEADPSPFFSAYDIHYGTLALKFGFNWNNKTCEGRLSSFGGLIGGTVLCGILF